MTTTIQQREDQTQIPTYTKWPITMVKGEDVWVWDDEGNRYLDLYGGHCVALIGHGHPHWVRAIEKQASTLSFYSNVCYNDTRAAYQEKLVAFAPEHLTHSFLVNSGAEANEVAIKLAMKATGRTGVIAMEGGFHGRTAGALSLTHLGHYREQFPAVVFDTKAIPFGDLDALADALDDNTAAVILEPVQSMNGMNTGPEAYFAALCQQCQVNGTMVIFDEIQTGFGRLGAPFAADRFTVFPDIITCAKGMGNGFPMAGVLVTPAVAESVDKGEQGTTFGGGPMACAAGLAVLDVLEEQGLVQHAAKMGALAREMLAVGPVTEILGYGLLIGLKTSVPAKDVITYLRENGILVGGSSDPNVIRLMPPLTVAREHFESLAAALEGWTV
jgi:acetylornithine aminotransferase/acetylornithine/N-succinyldiaminopimelate aminotransferase